MTVSELIIVLSKMPPSAIVCNGHVPGHHQLHLPLTHSGIVPRMATAGSNFHGETVFREDSAQGRIPIVTLD